MRYNVFVTKRKLESENFLFAGLYDFAIISRPCPAPTENYLPPPLSRPGMILKAPPQGGGAAPGYSPPRLASLISTFFLYMGRFVQTG